MAFTLRIYYVVSIASMNADQHYSLYIVYSQDILVYRHTYWKMTNLNNNWGSSARSADLCLRFC